MLASPGLTQFNFAVDNWGASPSTAPGTSVTPGATNVEGTFTQIFSAANVARDCYWLSLTIYGGSLSAQGHGMLLDIGVDPTGGTSYTAIISNIVVGQQVLTVAQAKRHYLFPFYIRAGSTVAIRIQGANSTPVACRVMAKLYGDPTNPELVPVGQFSETIGTITNSAGVTFTPGNGAYGTFVDLGATTNDMWWWQLGVQCQNATITALQTRVQLAYGDASNKAELVTEQHSGTTTEEMRVDLPGNMIWLEANKFVPAGSHIYVRGFCSSAPNTGWSAVGVGVGG